ncbi:hypothetical protein GZH46_02815 [Fragariocoptes setiger]|uniref:EGF-like domain-containing protein n=1 Tax=Fragariocoptes setiger TaxID=1670756 RepID=A0ABQ7S5I1_9ACAR|nr:hypothetical protein GZH46_02815 [Fragariocoptes setiger]
MLEQDLSEEEIRIRELYPSDNMEFPSVKLPLHRLMNQVATNGHVAVIVNTGGAGVSSADSDIAPSERPMLRTIDTLIGLTHEQMMTALKQQRSRQIVGNNDNDNAVKSACDIYIYQLTSSASGQEQQKQQLWLPANTATADEASDAIDAIEEAKSRLSRSVLARRVLGISLKLFLANSYALLCQKAVYEKSALLATPGGQSPDQSAQVPITRLRAEQRATARQRLVSSRVRLTPVSSIRTIDQAAIESTPVVGANERGTASVAVGPSSTAVTTTPSPLSPSSPLTGLQRARLRSRKPFGALASSSVALLSSAVVDSQSITGASSDGVTPTRSTKARFVVVTRTGQFGVRASAAAAAASASAAPAPVPAPTNVLATNQVRVSSRLFRPNLSQSAPATTTTTQASTTTSGAAINDNDSATNTAATDNSSESQKTVQNTSSATTASLPATTISTLASTANAESTATSTSNESKPTSNASNANNNDESTPTTTTTSTTSGNVNANANANDANEQDNSNARVVVTYFTTTTHTIPFTINSDTITTTFEETNSRVATEMVSSPGDAVLESTSFGGTSGVDMLTSPVVLASTATAQSDIEPSVTTLDTRTYYTTFTYFTTYLGDATPTVKSSESTTSNIVTETVVVPLSSVLVNGAGEVAPTPTSGALPPIEMTSLPSMTITPVAVTDQSSGGQSSTQDLGSTESPSVGDDNRSSSSSSSDTPTTSNENTSVQSSGASTPEMGNNEPPTRAPTPSVPSKPAASTLVLLDTSNSAGVGGSDATVRATPTLGDIRITRTRSMYTTLTHYITFYSGTRTMLSSVTEVSPTVVTYTDNIELMPTSTVALPPIEATQSVTSNAPAVAPLETTTAGIVTSNSQGESQPAAPSSSSADEQPTSTVQQPSSTTTTTTMTTSGDSATASSTTPVESSSPPVASVATESSDSAVTNGQSGGMQTSETTVAPQLQAASNSNKPESAGSANLLGRSDNNNNNGNGQNGQSFVGANAAGAVGEQDRDKDKATTATSTGGSRNNGNQYVERERERFTSQRPRVFGPKSRTSTTTSAPTTTSSTTTTTTTTTSTTTSTTTTPASATTAATYTSNGMMSQPAVNINLQASITSPTISGSSSIVSSTPTPTPAATSSADVATSKQQIAVQQMTNSRKQLTSNNNNKLAPATTIFFGDEPDGGERQAIKSVWLASPTTQYVTSVEPTTRTLLLTSTKVYYTRDAPITITSTYTTVIEPRTYVSTIVGTRTILNTATTQPVPTLSTAPALGHSGAALANAKNRYTSGTSGAPQVGTLGAVPSTNGGPVLSTPAQAKQEAARAAAVRDAQAKANQQLEREKEKQQLLLAKQRQQQQQRLLECQPACRTTNNEVCRSGQCVCRPGYHMMVSQMGARVCHEVNSYVLRLRVPLAALNRTTTTGVSTSTDHVEYQRALMHSVREHVKRAAMGSELVRDKFVGADIGSVSALLSASTRANAGNDQTDTLPLNVTLYVQAPQQTMDPLSFSASAGTGAHQQRPSAHGADGHQGAGPTNKDVLDERVLRDELTKRFASLQQQQSNSQESAATADSSSITMIAQPPDAMALTLDDVHDLDECASAALNDCHEGAVCINEMGSYRCDCRGYPDLDPIRPGHSCAPTLTACDYCNGRGDCHRVAITTPLTLRQTLNGNQTINSNSDSVSRTTQFATTCQCHKMYLGRRCEINGLLLATLLPIAAILCIVSVCLIIYCCRRWRKQRSTLSKGFRQNALGAFGVPNVLGSTLDRKAMLESSSESSESHSRAAAHAHAALYGETGHGAQLSTSDPSSSSESSPRQMARHQQALGGHYSMHHHQHRSQATGVGAPVMQATGGAAGGYCPTTNSSIPPQIVIPRARHNQVNYAVHRGQVYMW